MGRWQIETRAWQEILTHTCERARAGDTAEQLRQDIGGGYIRCERCGEKYLPDTAPGHVRLLFRLQRADEASIQIGTSA
jgi:DNA-directed RNA polymerase subunit RPC12/RpoP